MILSYFNSYFEVLVGLNLGYAAFDYFRRELTERIFKTDRLSDKLNNLQSRLKTHVSEERDNKALSSTLENINKKVEIEAKALKNQEESERCFLEILKPISFMLSLLCISFLVIAAFQDSSINKEFYDNYFFRLSCLVAVFTFTIFYCSFSDRIIKDKIKIRPIHILIIFSVFVTVSCDSLYGIIFVNLYWELASLIWFPISIYLFLLIIKVLKIKKYTDKGVKLFFTDLFELTRLNFFSIIVYLLILFVCFIPVIVYYNLKIASIKYIVVLLTPLFLYLFIYFYSCFDS